MATLSRATSASGRMVRRLDKFLSLSAAEHRLLLHVGLLLVAFRLGLWCVPYRLLRRAAEASPRDPAAPVAADLPAKIALNIGRLARFIPEATCLTQALTAHMLLRRGGYRPTLQLGVARNDQGTFQAHAWVECNSRIVVGGMATLPSFMRLHDERGSAMARVA